jgi:hypothetical protein
MSNTEAPNGRQADLLATIAFEGRYVPYAGITAVINQSSGPLAMAAHVPSVVILPYHHHVIRTEQHDPKRIGEVEVPFCDSAVSVEILQVENFYFLRPNDLRFFAGSNHPYDMPDVDLLRDALLFGVAVATALPVIAAHLDRNDGTWALVCHDWESITCSLALVQQPQHRLVLVLHNVYDGSVANVGLSNEMLSEVGIDPQLCPGPPHSTAATVLERALRLPTISRTVLAVSDQFAADILDDTYLAEALAPHIRETLRGRLCGNDNGLFAPLNVPHEALVEASCGSYDQLRKWKAKGKAEFLAALREHKATDDEPIWGDREAFIAADTADSTWLVTGGRDDSRQRGHDVLAAAVPNIIRKYRDARFLFFVMPGEEGLPGMKFLERLATRSPEQVIVLPFRFTGGYLPALRVSAWSIMPSFYGPFESANEFYLLGGVPGIARASGGLIQQIIPFRAAKSFSRAVRSRVDHWHPPSAHPTGILYRESDKLPNTLADWETINAADYRLTNGGDRVETRMNLPLFRAMVRELRLAVDDAFRVYKDERLYYTMISAGVDHLQRTFSWERNAEELVRLLLD